MTFGYARPFSFRVGLTSEPKPEPKVASVRHGVTEITLSDGRIVRATLHVDAVTQDPKNSDKLGISYRVVAEVVAKPETPILDVHETIQ